MKRLAQIIYRRLRATSAFSPIKLFSAGEQGVWYDPSDFSTMFQDAAGTTPVTAVEQPVGLLLDKSQGLVLGSELVTNGDFASPTGWTTGAGATISGGKLNLSAASGYVLYRNAVAGVQVGGYYEVTFTVSGYVSGSIRPYLGATATFGTTVSANGTYTQRFGPTSGGEVGFNSASAFTGAIDDLSVKAISGNHASQSTSASRPVLSARVNLLTYSEQFDNAAWLNAAGVVNVTANATTAPNGTMTADKLVPAAATTYFAKRQAVFISVIGASYSFSTYAKEGDTGVHLELISYNAAAPSPGAVFNLLTGAVLASRNCTTSVGPIDTYGFRRYTITFLATAVANTITDVKLTESSALDATMTGNGSKGFFAWGADLRPTNQTTLLPAYQRIAAATDYDTTGFPLYLAFDGTDDFLVTGAAANLGQVHSIWAGVRYLSIANGFNFSLLCGSGLADGNTKRFEFALYNNNPPLRIRSVYPSIDSFSTGLTLDAAPVTTLLGQERFSGTLVTQYKSNQTSQNITTASADFTEPNFFMIGKHGINAQYANMRLYGLVARGAANNATERADLQRWLAAKSGVTL